MGSRLPSRLGSKSSTNAQETIENEGPGSGKSGGLPDGKEPLDPISSSRVSLGRSGGSGTEVQDTKTITQDAGEGHEQMGGFTEDELSKAITQNTLKPASKGFSGVRGTN